MKTVKRGFEWIDLFFWSIKFGFRHRIYPAWRQWLFLLEDWEDEDLAQQQAEWFWRELNDLWRDESLKGDCKQ